MNQDGWGASGGGGVGALADSTGTETSTAGSELSFEDVDSPTGFAPSSPMKKTLDAFFCLVISWQRDGTSMTMASSFLLYVFFLFSR